MTKTKKPSFSESEKDFRELLNSVIENGRHVDYVKGVLKDFDEYKKVFDDIFENENNSDDVYIFRFNYRWIKNLWREIAISGTDKLDSLADKLIAWMLWDNDHLHSFSLKEKNGKKLHVYNQFSINSSQVEDDPFLTYKTDKVKVADINWKKYPEWNFVFDFGDGHEFDLEFKKVESSESYNVKNLPACIDQRGVAPEQYPYSQENEDFDDADDILEIIKKSKTKKTTPKKAKIKKAKKGWYPNTKKK